VIDHPTWMVEALDQTQEGSNLTELHPLRELHPLWSQKRKKKMTQWMSSLLSDLKALVIEVSMMTYLPLLLFVQLTKLRWKKIPCIKTQQKEADQLIEDLVVGQGVDQEVDHLVLVTRTKVFQQVLVNNM